MAVSAEDKQEFLDALARTGVIGTACREARISRGAVSNWRRDDEAFEDAYQTALDEALDAMESEARRRAVEGVTRQKALGSGDNMQIVDEQLYSDTLLMFLLKGGRPEKFAERSKTELSGPGGAALQTSHDITPAAARIAAILDEARRRRTEAIEPPSEDNDLDPFA